MGPEMPVVTVSNGEIASSPSWARYGSGAIAALLVGVTLSPLWWSGGEGTEPGLVPACAHWDGLARDSIAQLVQNGKRDAELRQVGDAIFHLRRARRNCHAGWVRLACQDYLAISKTVISRPSDECMTTGVDVAGAAQ